jgi:hypothetical protein
MMMPDCAAPFGTSMIHSVSFPKLWLPAAAAGWSDGTERPGGLARGRP